MRRTARAMADLNPRLAPGHSDLGFAPLIRMPYLYGIRNYCVLAWKRSDRSRFAVSLAKNKCIFYLEDDVVANGLEDLTEDLNYDLFAE